MREKGMSKEFSQTVSGFELAETVDPTGGSSGDIPHQPRQANPSHPYRSALRHQQRQQEMPDPRTRHEHPQRAQRPSTSAPMAQVSSSKPQTANGRRQ